MLVNGINNNEQLIFTTRSSVFHVLPDEWVNAKHESSSKNIYIYNNFKFLFL